MQIKKYSICNCNIEIKHNDTICDLFDYKLFLRDFDEPAFSFMVEKAESLPPKNGVCIHKDDMNSVYFDGVTRKNYTAFFDNNVQNAKDYTCKVDESKLYISCPDEVNEFFVFEGIRLPELLLEKGIGLLHCSFIEYEGQAILFAGDSGVGKSTQASLWEKYASANVINGDRAGLYIKDGVVYAGGVPYSGTSKICKNAHLPVRAVVCLSQGTENTLRRLSGIEAFTSLLGKFTYNTWDSAAVNAVSDLLTTIAENVPVYSYSCVKDSSAVQYLSERI